MRLGTLPVCHPHLDRVDQQLAHSAAEISTP
jgi:hypothetical protein